MRNTQSGSKWWAILAGKNGLIIKREATAMLKFQIMNTKIVQFNEFLYKWCHRRTHTVVDPNKLPQGMLGSMTPMPDLGNLSASLGLGAIGMPGYTEHLENSF